MWRRIKREGRGRGILFFMSSVQWPEPLHNCSSRLTVIPHFNVLFADNPISSQSACYLNWQEKKNEIVRIAFKNEISIYFLIYFLKTESLDPSYLLSILPLLLLTTSVVTFYYERLPLKIGGRVEFKEFKMSSMTTN